MPKSENTAKSKAVVSDSASRRAASKKVTADNAARRAAEKAAAVPVEER